MFFLLSPVGPRQNSKSSILSPRWEVHATKRFNWEYEFDPSFPIHLFPYQVMGNKDPMHWHRYHEIGLCVGGTGKFVYLNKVYPVKPGDIFISNNYESHVAISDGTQDCRYLFLIFLPSAISAPGSQAVDSQYLRFLNYNPLSFQNRIHADDPAADWLGELIRGAYQVYAKRSPFYQMELDILLRQVLLALSQARSSLENVQHVPNFSPKIAEAQVYINDHYTEHLTLSQVASHLNLNESYFRHLFKDEMQISFKSYVTLLRLAHAQKLLIASQRSINEIIQEVGYSNITQFYKIFELNYNLTPAEYRRRYRDSYADAPPL